MRRARIAQIIAWSVVAAILVLVLAGQMAFRSHRTAAPTQASANMEESREERVHPEVSDGETHHIEVEHSHPEKPQAPAAVGGFSGLSVYLDQRFDSGSIHSLSLSLGADDVFLFPSEDRQIRVVHRGRNLDEDRRIIARQDGETLSITQEKSVSFGLNFSIRTDSVVALYLPDADWDRLDLRLASGSMTLHRDLGTLRAKELTLDLASGDVDGSCDLAAETARLNLTSGDIQLQGLRAGRYDLEVSSGFLRLDHLQGSGTLQVASGDVELLGVEIAEKLGLDASSGSISLQLAGNPSLEFSGERSSGSIRTYFPVTRHDNQGHIISATVGDTPRKILSVRLASGDVKIDRS